MAALPPPSGPNPAGLPLPPQPVPPRPRKSFFARHKILTTLLVVGVVVVGASALSGSGGDGHADASQGDASTTAASKTGTSAGGGTASTTKSTAEKKAAQKTEKKTPGIGDEVRDGKFAFTVTKVETGVKSVGDQYLGEKAQGQFVLVHLKVENIGKKPQTFWGSNQTLTDTQGRQFDADDEAAIYLDESNALMEDVNPGNTVKGVVVFDVPKGAKLKTLELHDSAFSGGVTVSLAG